MSIGLAQVGSYTGSTYVNNAIAFNGKRKGVVSTIEYPDRIEKELTSNNVGKYYSIPFLEDSYYCDDEFSKDNSPKNKMPIRIELYSFEDIYELASNRNNIFFKLLKKEFEFNENNE